MKRYTEEELEEARKFKKEFGFQIPNPIMRMLLPRSYWLAREGAIEVLTLANEM